MSKRTDDFERYLANAIQNIFQNDNNYEAIPEWFLRTYGNPPYSLTNINVMGGELGKTDVLVKFQNIEQPLQISVKMANADYWGNWYSHKRFISEFGIVSFNKIVEDCTNWANQWLYNSNASLFIGVSVSFGKRVGNTARGLGEILTVEDVMSIIKGNFSKSELNANSTYISDEIPNNFKELFTYLNPITPETIIDSGILEDMKIIYRPINPMTEKSNRGKCIYTRYVPNHVFSEPITIDNIKELQENGRFHYVCDNSLNHNRQIKELEAKYNIVIPVKE